MAYISANGGSYYEGDRAHPLDIEVPQRPHLKAEWDGERWVRDEKAEHNEPLDAQIAALEAANPFTHRSLREGLYALAIFAELLIDRVARINNAIAAIEERIKSIPGNESFSLERLDTLPELKNNSGMKRIKAADDPIRALRAQRQP